MKILAIFIGLFIGLTNSAYAASKKATNAKPTPAVTPPEPETAPIAEPAQPMTAYSSDFSKDDSWRFAIGLGYILNAPEAKFSDLKVTTGTTTVTGEANLEYGKSASLVFEGRYMRQHAWGFMGGLNYEFIRRLEGGSISGSGTTTTITGGSSASKVQFTTLYANAVYRWENFYLPFGINLSSVKFTPADGFSGTHSESGGVGAQLGIGWMFNDSFSLEAYSWATSMKLKSSTSTTTTDYGTGIFPSLRIFAKYSF